MFVVFYYCLRTFYVFNVLCCTGTGWIKKSGRCKHMMEVAHGNPLIFGGISYVELCNVGIVGNSCKISGS